MLKYVIIKLIMIVVCNKKHVSIAEPPFIKEN